MGAVIAPICFLGGPILTRAAWYTAGTYEYYLNYGTNFNALKNIGSLLYSLFHIFVQVWLAGYQPSQRVLQVINFYTWVVH